ncbi:unnamed protein product [Rhizophagus irregularis]|nr:unnamed protein product [Rhizophagus irregularis]CAB5381153.1 unnamed protein product [Rhizophagus irregularis]
MSKVNYAETFRPLTDLFTQMQLNTILLAYLPQKLESYLTGIITVDMFITSVIACGISTLFPALFQFITMTGLPWGNKKNVTMQIEYYSEGRFGYPCPNVFYEALSWLISQQTKKLKDGSFIIQPVNSIYENDDDDDCAPPNFNVLPEKNQQITIEYKEKKYHVTYIIPEHPKQENNDNNDQISKQQQLKPSIYLTTAENPNETSVNTTTEFLNEIVRSYLETLKKMQVRSRYERSESYWHYVQTLSSARGLDSIALDESQEILLKKELETFVNDKSFYERIGMPYRRGILLYGKPGTGKTSLINAISSQLSRNIYYLNLKNIKNDNELSAAFSEVPENQIIVLEDVDTQSKILHKRTKNSKSSKTSNKSDDKSKDDKVDKEDRFSDFSLSTFLGCLDGHILADGNIIIMTTNHVEHLDPACIRPGRMDVRLNLGYCTHYQIKKMYKSVAENPEAEFPQDILEKIPEKSLPPCEVMMTMILYRSEIELIPQKIYELVAKYKDINSEEASADLTEKKETESEEVKDKNNDKKEDIKSEKEEIKDENNDKKENIKGEKEEIKDENNDKKENIKGEKEEIKDENNDKKEDIKGEKEKIKDKNNDKKENVKDEEEKIKDENKDKKENVKDEEEKIKDENKDKKENVKDEKEKIRDENKDKKEDINDEIKKKEVVNEDVKDENKEDNKEDKKEEEIINEANINDLNEVINAEEDSDSITDVELEIENDKIKHFKTLETFTITPQIAKKNIVQ